MSGKEKNSRQMGFVWKYWTFPCDTPTFCKLPVYASFCDLYQWDQCGFKTSGLTDWCSRPCTNSLFPDIQICISQLRHHTTAHTSASCREGQDTLKNLYLASAFLMKSTEFVFPEAEWQQFCWSQPGEPAFASPQFSFTLSFRLKWLLNQVHSMERRWFNRKPSKH